MSDKVVALNYCAHAIEDLLVQADRTASFAPRSAEIMLRLVQKLRSSVKFILPNRADLIPDSEVRQAHLDLARLPYPCVAFEAPWEQEPVFIDREGPFQERLASKRIALCWEADPASELIPGINSILSRHPGGGTFVVPIFWGPEIGHWNAALGGTFLPHENEMLKPGVEPIAGPSQAALDAIVDAGLGKANALQFAAEPFLLFPEMFDIAVQELGSRDKAFTNIILDSRDECVAMLKACSVINCANVSTVHVEPPAALNKKRQASGKQPFFTYKVLQLASEARPPSRSAGGTHTGPRMHLRRGHLRRLEAKTVWVRATMVAASTEAGFVAKDYAVAKPGS